MDINRRTAFFIIKDVEEKKAYSHIAVNNYVGKMRPTQVPFVRELAYGVLREKLLLDYIITGFVRTPMEKMDRTDLILLRMGIYQILRMNSVPDYAAVSETVDLAKKYAIGRDGFINGVLRQFLRDREYVDYPDRAEDEVRHLSIRYSYAPWIVEMWLKEFGAEQAEKLLAAGNTVPEVSIRVNLLKTNREDLFRRMAARGYKVRMNENCPTGLYVSGEDILGGRFYKSGLYSVQDEGSMAVVAALDARPGQTVVDVCAAPGGKTMAIAEGMENNGAVTATDLYKRKLYHIKEQAQRLGITIVKTWSWDATRLDSDLVETADRVLADVPCSGLGTVRKKPEIKYKNFEGEVENLPRIQKDILTTSSAYVKPGGILVYSTCTISERENQQVVRAFLKENRNFEQIDARLLLPGRDDSDGFFICKMQRKGTLI